MEQFSNRSPIYLKPDIILEPLVEGWYAWAHLISPATAAMNILGRHLKIMTSYIQSPMIHEAAVRNPKMLGGPFMDYKTPKVEEIKILRASTLKNQSQLIELAHAIKDLDRLVKSADGFSLENMYSEVPELLKGYVELVYDLNNQASFRFFESLLYQSKFYNKNSQSIALWESKNDDRPFCLSTPRLASKDVLNLNIAFDNPVIDSLSKMKRSPNSLDQIACELGIKEQDLNLFSSFFTATVPSKYQKYQGSKARMRYFGHACILIETDTISILVDPLISYYGNNSNVSHFSDVDLPDVIDFVLITHNHQDHILLETLLPLRHKIKNMVVPHSASGALQDPSLKLIFKALGFKNVIAIDEMEQVIFDSCKITGIPFTGEHSDLNIKAKTCYHVSIDQFSFLFVADSRIVEPELYKHVFKVIGDVDVLFVGMECDGAPLTWLYGPLLTEQLSRDKDQSRRLSGSDFQRGMSLIEIFHPSEVYVYAMGQEPWLEFISTVKYTEESNPIIQSNLLIEECNKRDIVAERLFGEKELFYNTSR